MWTSRSTAGPAVDVAAERERVLARRAESFRQEASEPLFQSGWQAAAQSPLSERPQIDYTTDTSMPGEPKPNPAEAPLIKAAAGPKLTLELRTQLKALVRRELTQDPAVSASVVRRKVEGELDIGLNHATFHGTYWRKVKAELEKETGPHAAAADAAPDVISPGEDGAEPPSAALASPQEQISMAPGPNGQWRVQVQVLASRAQALCLMRAVVEVLAAEE